ncbi:MAG TPA: sulfotransferase, partial [Anaerolineales bacterium]|nr:sulfotransferase [Anaerolineales bacterium]
MESTAARPVFIVGSPRSGTSILTWCLGQHPNILPLDESTGLGKLTIALGTCYQTKMGLGEQSLWTAMDVQKAEFFAAFGRVINEFILGHQADLERRRWEEAAGPMVSRDMFVANQSAKARWVDGTPQYSDHIYGLRLLFP